MVMMTGLRKVNKGSFDPKKTHPVLDPKKTPPVIVTLPFTDHFTTFITQIT